MQIQGVICPDRVARAALVKQVEMEEAARTCNCNLI